MIIPVAAYRRGLTKADPSPYYTPANAQAKTLQNFLDTSSVTSNYNNEQTTVLPQYDWATKALQEGANADKLVGQSASNAVANQLAVQAKQLKKSQKNATGSTGLIPPPGTAGGNTKLGALLRALGAQESGNNFGAVNKSSGALGQWQVMPSNVAGWSKQALGHAITSQQFLADPHLQKKVVKNVFGGYVKKYGAKGALSAWYSGDPNRWKDSSKVSSGPSVAAYVNSVLSKLG
jgi:hypothetical protein